MSHLLPSVNVGNPSETGVVDRISELPESIIHRILTHCNTFDGPRAHIVRMSVLSKKLFDLTASFPVLDFIMVKFTNVHVSRESFFKHVDYTVSRFCLQNVPAFRLIVTTNIQEHAELDTVKRCVELVLEKGVKDLDIDITSLADVPKYRFPNILLSVSVLMELRIQGCELPSSLMVDDIKFKSLIHLTLTNVRIDDDAITYLIASCSLLQFFYIRWCYGFKRLCVQRHQNFRVVWIQYNTLVDRIDIEAPNLSTLTIEGNYGRVVPQMNLAACKKVTSIYYYSCPSNDLSDFLSNFPIIENLYLCANYKFKNLKLSSPSLRKLMLYCLFHLIDFEEIELSTPNLVVFRYPCSPSSINTVLSNSTQLKACMQCYFNNFMDVRLFLNLRQFFHKKNGFKVLNLCIYIKYSEKYIQILKPKAYELPPYELEHVKIQLYAHEESPAHVAFVDAVLWCCRPRSLTLGASFPLIDFGEQTDVVKFTYEKLLQQEDQAHTSIQMGLPHEGKEIMFKKKQGTHILSAN
ncbi:F-box/FBD/LRR-repeat protein At5g44980-like [Bidens hawaiensis]|uniref:F-box/FBD/LRR-repeat protein At5g44980-like n=1 Tax=Bidens hawaiensis TaxID=980011 RepID=UPI00404B0EB6